MIFMIVKKGQYFVEEYEKRLDTLSEKYKDYYNKLNVKFANTNKKQYRGISRQPLSPIPEKLKESYSNIIEPIAQFYLDKITSAYQDNDNYYDDSLSSIDECLSVYKEIVEKKKYEIIKIERSTITNNENFLGYDIGYSGGDHFSVIVDTFLFPMWHPVPEEEFDEIEKYYRNLNQNLLFKNHEDASEYLEYYSNKSWAEKESEPGEICVQRIDTVLLEKNGA